MYFGHWNEAGKNMLPKQYVFHGPPGVTLYYAVLSKITPSPMNNWKFPNSNFNHSDQNSNQCQDYLDVSVLAMIAHSLI